MISSQIYNKRLFVANILNKYLYFYEYDI